MSKDRLKWISSGQKYSTFLTIFDNLQAIPDDFFKPFWKNFSFKILVKNYRYLQGKRVDSINWIYEHKEGPKVSYNRISVVFPV